MTKNIPVPLEKCYQNEYNVNRMAISTNRSRVLIIMIWKPI